MGMFTGLNTMVRGIYVNQTALNTTGHNIVNADTEGYSRQKLNIITTDSEYRSSAYGSVALGTGAEIQSITRARDQFADIQYRDESCTLSYYEAVANNYDKLEVIFNDAQNEGVQSQILKFYQTWVSDLSTESSNSANRVAVIEQARNFRDAILTSNQQLKDQIEYNYYFLGVNIDQVNDILQGLTEANKLVVSYESTGASANDIRDKRDLLVDKLATYMPVQVHEDEFGNYQVTSGGTTFVSGVDRLHLALSPSIESKYFGVDYGVEDHSIVIKESGVAFMPANGSLKANVEAIETCKSYIKDLANIAGFFLTTFNDQHRQGYDMRGGTKSLTTMIEESARNTTTGEIAVDSDGATHSVFRYVGNTQGSYKCIQDANGRNLQYTDANGNAIPGAYRCYYVGEGKGDFEVNRVEGTYYYELASETTTSGGTTTTTYNGNFDTDTKLDDTGNYTVYYKRVADGTGHYKISLVETTELPDGIAGSSDTVKVPDTINFFGNDNTFYTYSYDADWDTNVVEAVGLDGVKRRLTGSAIIEQLQLNSKLDTPEGYMYLAAATAYDDQNNYSEFTSYSKVVTDSDTYLSRMVSWNDRTGDGTNAVFLSELFNMPYETITAVGRSNSFIINRYQNWTGINSIGGKSINNYYISMATRLSVEAADGDTRISQQEAVVTQARNWRDSTMGVDWNEELTNMIKYQKAFVACSRCLNAMDECLERLVSSTGAVGR